MFRILLTAIAACLALPLQAEELLVRGDRLFVFVEIRGERVEALLDSGAEVTIFDRKTAERLLIGGGVEVETRGTGAGTTKAELVENVPVRTLGRELVIPVAAVMDLSDVGARLIGTSVPMILGREVFDAGRLAIDIEAATIAWLPDDGEVGGMKLSLTPANGIETIPVQFGEEIAVDADFDLGNGTGLLISSDLAERLALAPVGIEPGGGIGGSVGRPVVYLPEMTIAGRPFRNIRAHVTEDSRVAANVGVNILRQFLIVTDFAKRHIWLEPRRGVRAE